MQLKIVCASLLMAFLSQGCATFVHGTRQDLNITTNPPGVTATVKKHSCVTPCTLIVPRTAGYVTLQKGPYREEFFLDKRFNFGATLFGNVLWFVPGVLIDAVAGGAYEIKPVDVKIADAAAGTPEAEAAAKSAGAEIVGGAQVKARPDERDYAWNAGISNYKTGLLDNHRGSIVHVGFERMLGRITAIYANVGYTDNKSFSHLSKDDSRGFGGEIGARFYSYHAAQAGWYRGIGFGIWSLKGKWRGRASGTSTVDYPTIHVGYKWRPKRSRYYVDPSLGLGFFFPGGGAPAPAGLGIRAGMAVGKTW